MVEKSGTVLGPKEEHLSAGEHLGAGSRKRELGAPAAQEETLPEIPREVGILEDRSKRR